MSALITKQTSIDLSSLERHVTDSKSGIPSFALPPTSPPTPTLSTQVAQPLAPIRRHLRQWIISDTCCWPVELAPCHSIAPVCLSSLLLVHSRRLSCLKLSRCRSPTRRSPAPNVRQATLHAPTSVPTRRKTLSLCSPWGTHFAHRSAPVHLRSRVVSVIRLYAGQPNWPLALRFSVASTFAAEVLQLCSVETFWRGRTGRQQSA